MAAETIEKNCKEILKGLEQNQFTRQDIEFLQKFFQELIRITKGKL